MKYVVATINTKNRYHHSHDGDRPFCRSQAEYKEIDESDTDGLTLCQHCAMETHYHISYDEESLTEKILDAVEDVWKTPNELADEYQPSPSVFRRRLNELVESGEVNRRGQIADNNGGKGYEYSQLEREQVSHEENNQLFESMLAND